MEEVRKVFKRNGYTCIDRSIANIRGANKISKIVTFALIKSWKRSNTIYKEVTDTIISDVTYLQLETQLKMNIDNIIPDLIKSKVFKAVYKRKQGVKERNIYTFIPENNYFFIDNRYFENTTKDNNKIKGFLILLKCYCQYNTNLYKSRRPRKGKCNITELAALLDIDEKTLRKYIKLAIDYNWLKEIEDGLMITNEYIKVDRIADNSLASYLYEVIYRWCVSHNCIPPKREEAPLNALSGAYPLNDADYLFYKDNNIKCKGYLPQALEERLSNMPDKVNWQYLITALLNNKDMMRKETLIIPITL